MPVNKLYDREGSDLSLGDQDRCEGLCTYLYFV